MLKSFIIETKVKPLSNRAQSLDLGISPEGKMFLKGNFLNKNLQASQRRLEAYHIRLKLIQH